MLILWFKICFLSAIQAVLFTTTCTYYYFLHFLPSELLKWKSRSMCLLFLFLNTTFNQLLFKLLLRMVCLMLIISCCYVPGSPFMFFAHCCNHQIIPFFKLHVWWELKLLHLGRPADHFSSSIVNWMKVSLSNSICIDF